MQEITLVTGNLGKWKITKDIFDKYNINLLHEKLILQKYNQMT